MVDESSCRWPSIVGQSRFPKSAVLQSMLSGRACEARRKEERAHGHREDGELPMLHLRIRGFRYVGDLANVFIMHYFACDDEEPTE